MHRQSPRLAKNNSEIDLAARQSRLLTQAMKFSLILLQENKFEEAVTCYDLCLRADSDNVLALTAKKDVLITIAKFHYQNAEYGKSFLAFSNAMEVKIQNPNYLRDIAQGFLDLAKAYAASGNYTLAIDCYAACTRVRSGINEIIIDALLGWSRAIIRTRNYDGCIQLLMNAKELIGKDECPQYRAAFCEYMGLKLRRCKKFDSAIETYKELLVIEPNNLLALCGLGVLCRVKEPELALACLNKALAIEPHSVHYWQVKAMYYQEHDAFDEELACYDKVLEIEPNNFPAAQSKIGLFYRRNLAMEDVSREPTELPNRRANKRNKAE